MTESTLTGGGMTAPLAVRMRPRSLDEVVGQQHLLKPGSPLRSLADPAETGQGKGAISVILWGPPGTGKTTLAQAIAHSSGRNFVELSAVTAGVKDVRVVMERALNERDLYGVATVLFLDEIHRFTKAQQDALLPGVENGWVTLVAATTENPSFSVISPLLSRSLLLTLQPLTDRELGTLLRRAATEERGLGDRIPVDEDAYELIVKLASGDARRALTTLEAAAASAVAIAEADAAGAAHPDGPGAGHPGPEAEGSVHTEDPEGTEDTEGGADDAAAVPSGAVDPGAADPEDAHDDPHAAGLAEEIAELTALAAAGDEDAADLAAELSAEPLTLRAQLRAAARGDGSAGAAADAGHDPDQGRGSDESAVSGESAGPDAGDQDAAAPDGPAAHEGPRITAEVVATAVDRALLRYDRNGDEHYDVISAFIKSVRGSDPDAALHYLARMIEAGEDPRFIARRVIVLAAEDIGLADPAALGIAVAAAEATQMIGMPEARIPLAEAVVYLACAPKSNTAYVAIDAAIADVRAGRIGRVPIHLRDGHYAGAKRLGHGKGYRYPHDTELGVATQQYLPDELRAQRYYLPGTHGNERAVAERLPKIQRILRGERTPPKPAPAPQQPDPQRPQSP
ncbi:replication-associated recombination protein A [Leucobacter sp. M11]|uniref:replication-associated recombination protein A n=1 Tax=Leucobacter sp. M11 TaxID=2993565 RepID=UPI002D80B2AB|nr:replication-associated recombination protein A [Leucobacter sp. M11]MEB4616219.1 replication-associated recombination protein A [Leucobacter sp. M11]